MSSFDQGDAEPFEAVTGPPRAVLAGRPVVAWALRWLTPGMPTKSDTTAS